MNRKHYALLSILSFSCLIAGILFYYTTYKLDTPHPSLQSLSGDSLSVLSQSNVSTASILTSTVDPANVTTMVTEAGGDSDHGTAMSTRDFYIGLTLACSSSIFIGASFIFKKKGLLNLQVRAGAGGFGYLREPLWWAGLIMMAGGEAANFTAYLFAPASLVTPLGALSVIVAALLASRFLNEKLNLIGKIGCGLCVVGSTVIVIHSPEEQHVKSMHELAQKLIDPGFIIYVCLVAIVSLVMIFYYAPKIGQTNILIYILICSVVGSLSVMACKAVGVAIMQTFNNDNQFTNWLTYFFIVQLAVCISIQMIYLNKALDTFNTSVVTPIYYVFFTTFVIIASAVLFKEWGNMDVKGVLGNISGFLTVVGGIFLLNAFRDMKITIRDIANTAKQRPTSTVSTSNLEAQYADHDDPTHEMHQLLESGHGEDFPDRSNGSILHREDNSFSPKRLK